MKMEPECISCSFRQSERVLNFLNLSREEKLKILQKIAKYYSEIDDNFVKTPAYYGSFVYNLINEITGIEDPYKPIKDKFNKLILSMKDIIENFINKSNDRIYTALKFSSIGNQIDFGVDVPINIEEEIHLIEKIKFTIDDYKLFKEHLSNRKSLLLLADNAGEVVFDIILLEEIHSIYPDITLTIGVKSFPIINDITIKDISDMKLPDYIKVIENGNRFVGTILDKSSKEFKDIFFSSDIILSKGQANFETLNNFHKKDIFFLFKSKCEIVARFLNVQVGDNIFWFNNK